MKRLIITEEEKIKILNLHNSFLINEQLSELVQGAPGDPYQYKRQKDSLGNYVYSVAKKNSNNWVVIKSKESIDKINQIVFNKKNEAPNFKLKDITDFGSKLYSNISDTAYNVVNNFGKLISYDNKSKKVNNGYDAIFIGGLDYRPNDKNLETQVDLFKQGYGINKKVKGFKYNAPTSEIISFLMKTPKIPIFMFSAGTAKAYELSLNPNVDKNKMFVIEPHIGYKDIIKGFVSNGGNSKNIFVGDVPVRGKDIVPNTSSSKVDNHWDAITSVGNMKSNLV